MRPALVATLCIALLAGGLVWWLRRAPSVPGGTEPTTRLVPRPTRWTTPISPQGQRTLRGHVLRDGAGVAGAEVTAVAGRSETLERALCTNPNHPPRRVVDCECEVASEQLLELVLSREGESVPLARALTDDRGAFALEGLDDQPVTVWADSKLGLGWARDVSAQSGEPTITLGAGRQLDVFVSRRDGQSVTGALVTVFSYSPLRSFDVVVGADGRAAFDWLPPGELFVVAAHEGVLPDWQRTAKHQRDVELTLAPARTLAGTVFLEGEPGADVEVQLRGNGRAQVTRTASDGRFSFRGLRAGTWKVRAERPPHLANAVLDLRDESLDDVVLELGAGLAVRGLVEDEAHRPLSEVEVRASDALSRPVVTGRDGRFSFPALEADELVLTATRQGFLAAQVEVTSQEVTLTLKPSVVLAGRVEDTNGRGVDSFRVVARLEGEDDNLVYGRAPAGSVESTNGVDGGFSLEVTPGHFTLEVEATGFRSSSLDVTAPRADVRVVLVRGARVVGSVVDASGAASTGWVTMEQKGFSSMLETDRLGRFEFDGLAPGRVGLLVEHREDELVTWTGRRDVDVVGDETLTVVLSPRSGRTVTGVVREADGTPAPNVEVVAFLTERREPGSGARTDTQGHFVLAGIAPKEPTVIVAKLGTRKASHDLDERESNVELQLPEGATVRGCVRNASGQPVRTYLLKRDPVSSPDGCFTKDVRPGPIELVIEAPGHAPHLVRTTAKLGVNDVGTIRLGLPTALRGTVRDAQTLAPVPGARIESGTRWLDPAVTDAQGRYRLVLVDGVETLVVSHTTHVRREVAVSRATSEQDVLLENGASLTVKVLDAQGKTPRVRVTVWNARESRSLQREGELFITRGLGPGTYSVFAQGDDEAQWRAVKLEVGTAPVSLELRAIAGGVTVHLSMEGADALALAPGVMPPLNTFDDLLRELGVVEVKNGTVSNISPGTWSALGIRQTSAGWQTTTTVIEVPATGEPTFRLTPRWQSVTGELFAE